MKRIQLHTIINLIKKNWEFSLALFFFFLIAISIWVEFTFFKFDLYSFLFVVNFNLLLLFITLYIVIKRLFGLFVERKRKIFGSHLRSRLVVAFVLTSLIPGIFIFFIFTRIVSTSVNHWFSSQVEDTLEKASTLGTTFFTTVSESLQEQAGQILLLTYDRGPSNNTVVSLDILEQELYKNPNSIQYNSMFFITSEYTPVFPISERERALLINIIPTLQQTNFETTEYTSFLEDVEQQDYVVFVQKVYYTSGTLRNFIGPMQEGYVRTGYLVLTKVVGRGFTEAQREIITGVIDYKKVYAYKNPIKISFFYLLGILTLLIIFGSTWYGLRISRELTAPIVDLAKAFEKISRGELDIVLKEQNMPEEMQMLVTSFNTMAKELSQSHSKLVLANTNLERNNREIEVQKAHIETIIENITTGVIAIDANGRIERVNRPISHVFGVQSSELVGKRLESFIPKAFMPFYKEMQSMLDDGEKKWQEQITLKVGEEEKKFLVMALALPLSSSYKGRILVVDDITELDKSYRIEAWREVARRIAHEIKNPLTPIKLSAQRLMKRYANVITDPVFTDCTHQIIHHVEHLQQLVTEFSRFARLPEIVRTMGNIEQTLKENIQFFSITYPHIEFTYSCMDTIPSLLFDTSAMQRVFMNILKNAVEALEGIEQATVDAHISYNSTMHIVQIQIHDNGRGIPEYEKKRLFEPYFSSKKEGTGLGLAIVQSIIADHRGYIRVISSKEKGTTIVIDLPV